MPAELIDRYEIVAEIGHGGMATVYLGRDPDGREAAIKVLRREYLTDLGFRARFEREAQTIAALEHPAIVPLLSFGRHEEQLYLVMPYMPGGTLALRLHQGALTTETAGSILARIAPALDSAHLAGVVHGDLKPSNILLDADGQAYLADFGIAMQTAPGGVEHAVVAGTPAYMSPEQCRPEEEVDARSDIYALGITLFQVLTGRLPFDGDTPLAILAQHIHQSPPALNSLNPGLPASLGQVIDKALRKEPAARFQTVGDFSAAYQRALAAPYVEGETEGSTQEDFVIPAVQGSADEVGPATPQPPEGPIHQWRSLQDGMSHQVEVTKGWLVTHFAAAVVLVTLLGALCAATAVIAIRGSFVSVSQAESTDVVALPPTTEAVFLPVVRAEGTQNSTAAPGAPASLDISGSSIPPEAAPLPNLLLIYTDARMTAINVSSQNLSLRELTFIRPQAEAVGAAIFAANEWNQVARRAVAALAPGDCLQLIRLDSASPFPQAPSPCDKIQGWLSTRREERLFFFSAAGAGDFELHRGEQFIGRCAIAAGECRVYIPQP